MSLVSHCQYLLENKAYKKSLILTLSEIALYFKPKNPILQQLSHDAYSNLLNKTWILSPCYSNYQKKLLIISFFYTLIKEHYFIL